MIVELHILQNFAPSNLNRDDTNSPKECQFGGCRRARISSQCMKRAIREYFRENLLVSPENLAKRTRLVRGEIAKRLQGLGNKSEEDAKKAASEVVKALGFAFKDSDRTEYLIFVGEKEIEAIAHVALDHWADLTSTSLDEKTRKAIGDELKSKLDGGTACDLALFGRMLADLPVKNIDAACQVAHAISTHKVGVEFDFYTAVDDLQPEEETGAGMMGDIEFNSACYYRYADIDLGQLRRNLAGKEWDKASEAEKSDANDLAVKTVEAFLHAAVAAIPTGKQNSFSAQNPPDFVLAVVRESGAWSLANAFAHPVAVKEGSDLVADSIAALVDYWGKLKQFYGDDGITAAPAMALHGNDLDGMEEVAGLKDLVHRVKQAIAAER
ncbi:MAG: type I-E CRISPR-associated protein Cas7/Cse4/CasC [Chloroflexota bacterium]|nr:type I-E CRISPR-associated protein Cas7/Cse4/CasC [Chloroflexota bacterium]